jgi:predicted Zn finger-like uncharacterized protein
MIIICEKCATAYNMDESLIDDAGSTVRCTKCRHQFVVYPKNENGDLDSDRILAGEPQTQGDEDSLGLLATEPIHVDFADSTGLTDDEDTSATNLDEAEIDADPEFADDGTMVDTEDDPETFADGDLPAIEDLDDLVETLLAEDDESPAIESYDPDEELMHEAETTASAAGETDSSQGDVLDLSDIEDLIDSGDFPGAVESTAGDFENGEPVLELAEDDRREKIDSSGIDSGSGEIDISDLEKILAEDEEPAPEEPLLEEDEEPELVFEGLFESIADGKNPEPAADRAPESDGTVKDPEIEIFLNQEGGEPSVPVPAPDIEPDILFPETALAELQGDILHPDDSGTVSEPDGGESTFGTVDSEETAVFDEGTTVIDSAPGKQPCPIRKRKSRKPFLAAAAALMLTAAVAFVGARAGLRVPNVTGILKNIPFAGDFFISEKADPAGNLMIMPLEESISGKFIDNSSTGKLFVIKGRVQNAYDHPRSHIRIVGRLYKKGSRLSKTARVYCGNILSDSELEVMDMGVISRRLGNPSGDGRSNLEVKKGNAVPFMIVFNQLPDNLDEFSIEVAGSSG